MSSQDRFRTDHGIDWARLAVAVGALEAEGGQEHGGTSYACQAIETLLGEEALADAVDHYIAGHPGSELARSVLWHIHSPRAMERCHEIYGSKAPLASRRLAVELLRVVADARALPWAREFLDDPDEQIQAWGIGLLDQLVFSKLVHPNDCPDLFNAALSHKNPHVREKAEEILAWQSGDSE